MKRRGFLLALAATACAHQPTMDAPASLAAAETAFAAHSMREDMRAAFLANFADDGVLVRSGWIVSNEWLRGRPAPAITLDWRPQYVEVAASGELGLSTGPTKITSKSDPAEAPGYGQYVSIWRREGAGPWKVAVDLGISHPEPSLWKEPLDARTTPPAVAAAGDGIAGAEARWPPAPSATTGSNGRSSAWRPRAPANSVTRGADTRQSVRRNPRWGGSCAPGAGSATAGGSLST